MFGQGVTDHDGKLYPGQAFAIDSRWRSPTVTKARKSRIAASRSILGINGVLKTQDNLSSASPAWPAKRASALLALIGDKLDYVGRLRGGRSM